MNILVTGGLGFIGLNFCLLVQELRPNWRLRVLDSFTYAANSPDLLSKSGEIHVIRADIRDLDNVAPHIRWCDAVINFAAESHNDNSLKHPRKFIDTNIMGTMVLADLCLQLDKRMHQVSTDEVYGDTALDSDEEFSLDSCFRPSSPYSSTKAAADLMLMAWNKSFGLRVTISHSTNNFGAFQHGEKFLPRMFSLIKAGRSPELYGNGQNVRDWINVSDHCRGLILALESQLIGSRFHFAANDRVANIEIVKNILLEMNAKDLNIKFTSDRPAHDRRYALSYSETSSLLGWIPESPRILDSLGWLRKLYG